MAELSGDPAEPTEQDPPDETPEGGPPDADPEDQEAHPVQEVPEWR